MICDWYHIFVGSSPVHDNPIGPVMVNVPV